jgi:hypothetical protein
MTLKEAIGGEDRSRKEILNSSSTDSLVQPVRRWLSYTCPSKQLLH